MTKSKAAYPLKKAPKYMLPQEITIKTQVKSPSETRETILCHWKAAHSKPGQLTFWNKTGLCVTRRVHINKEANSHSEAREATLPSEECTLKTRPTHTLKQSRPPSVTRRVHIKQGQLAIWSKTGHSLCHQKSAHQKPGQLTNWNKTGQCLSPEEWKLKTRPTHNLKQDRP